ncbi:hypothetical protein GDO86_011331 [Hymenochirus boettgeri]|uniref:Uncharacterized protein n=1 Tax=Hymenochirus boettgeri TaxID=247094 RepID=A0A8T2JG15_9PIPI|nr:hypothetical protein GDO86_011331 [Hymenochirus boettgeri]
MSDTYAMTQVALAHINLLCCKHYGGNISTSPMLTTFGWQHHSVDVAINPVMSCFSSSEHTVLATVNFDWFANIMAGNTSTPACLRPYWLAT